MVAQSILDLGMSRKVLKHKEELIGLECCSGAAMFPQHLEYWHIVAGQEIIAIRKSAKDKEGTMQIQ